MIKCDKCISHGMDSLKEGRCFEQEPYKTLDETIICCLLLLYFFVVFLGTTTKAQSRAPIDQTNEQSFRKTYFPRVSSLSIINQKFVGQFNPSLPFKIQHPSIFHPSKKIAFFFMNLIFPKYSDPLFPRFIKIWVCSTTISFEHKSKPW